MRPPNLFEHPGRVFVVRVDEASQPTLAAGVGTLEPTLAAGVGTQELSPKMIGSC